MGLKEVLKREFGVTAMRSRAARKDIAHDAKFLLDCWADYGDPKVAHQIIALIQDNSKD